MPRGTAEWHLLAYFGRVLEQLALKFDQNGVRTRALPESSRLPTQELMLLGLKSTPSDISEGM